MVSACGTSTPTMPFHWPSIHRARGIVRFTGDTRGCRAERQHSSVAPGRDGGALTAASVALRRPVPTQRPGAFLPPGAQPGSDRSPSAGVLTSRGLMPKTAGRSTRRAGCYCMATWHAESADACWPWSAGRSIRDHAAAGVDPRHRGAKDPSAGACRGQRAGRRRPDPRRVDPRPGSHPLPPRSVILAYTG